MWLLSNINETAQEYRQMWWYPSKHREDQALVLFSADTQFSLNLIHFGVHPPALHPQSPRNTKMTREDFQWMRWSVAPTCLFSQQEERSSGQAGKLQDTDQCWSGFIVRHWKDKPHKYQVWQAFHICIVRKTFVCILACAGVRYSFKPSVGYIELFIMVGFTENCTSRFLCSNQVAKEYLFHLFQQSLCCSQTC